MEIRQTEEVEEFIKRQSAFYRRTEKRLRDAIISAAKVIPLCGELHASLKWGQLSFSTHNPRTGTPVRLANIDESEQRCELCVHCQTQLIEQISQRYPELEVANNRSLYLSEDALDSEPVRDFLRTALSYHVAR